MNTLKLIGLTILQLPRAMVHAFKKQPKREPTAREIEAERIDRIRFPSKYLGK